MDEEKAIQALTDSAEIPQPEDQQSPTSKVSNDIVTEATSEMPA